MAETLDRGQLATLAGQTLEEAAFVFSEPDDDAPLWPGEVVEIAIPFTGRLAGRMVLAPSPDFGVPHAANLLGVELEDAGVAQKGEEALGEILNIIGGAYMQAVFGADAGRRMGVPARRRLAGAAFADRLGEAACAASLLTEEGHRVDLAVFLDP